MVQPTQWSESVERAVVGPTARQTLRAGLLGLLYGLLGSAAAVAVAWLGPSRWHLGWFVVGIVTWMSVAMLLAIWWHVVRRDGLPWSALGVRAPTWRLLHVLWQAPALVFAALVVQIVFTVLTSGVGGDNSDDVFDGIELSPLLAVAILVAVAVITPIWEELYFRGMVFGAISRRLPLAVAALVAGVLFAAVHLAWPAMPYLAVMGVGLCLIYAFHRSIWASMLVHAFNNLLASGAVLAAMAG